MSYKFSELRALGLKPGYPVECSGCGGYGITDSGKKCRRCGGSGERWTVSE